MTFYEEVGGEATFVALVHAFYENVRADAALRALYPEEDLGPAERRLRMFLEQYFQGPTTYSQERGHPRLRMRHMPYAVTPDMRDRWLAAMLGALEATPVPDEHRAKMREYFLMAAQSLVNASDQ